MSETVPIYGFGGGGAALNFDVKQYTKESQLLAAKPKENTIGVITTTAITNWYFAAEQPENMVNGNVWFPTGTSSAVAFNALKKNAVQVYPLSAKQMVGNALVDVTAMSYRGGKWVSWITYLYNNGNECDYITGGWIECGTKTSYYPNKGTIVREADGIKLSIGNKAFSLMRPENMIDLTNVRSIYLEIECIQNPKNIYHPQFYVSELTTHTPDNANSVPALLSAVVTPGNTETFDLNVSNISGEYYVYIGFPNYENTVNIYKIREVGLRG